MRKLLEQQRAKLWGSLILFTQVFYRLRLNREFEISEPIGRESHYLSLSRALTKTARGESNRLIINVPPRYGKTELCIHYIAWMLSRYPDSNFLYVSYSHSLAKKQTQTIRQILNIPDYKRLFGVEISKESSAKDNFETTAGGSVYAAGSNGTITGRGAGIQHCDRFGGAIVIDDIHKPSEVVSDTMRQSVIDWYLNTLQSRVNSGSTPIIFIGQRLHEDDLASNLLKGFDGNKWDNVILPALDGAKNALYPALHSKEKLMKMRATMPYDFAAQYQQNPQPSGGGIFKRDWFLLLDDIPDLLGTFITVDTAETSKTYNDATVFSLWGVYEIMVNGGYTGLHGLVWLDCHQCWVEPKDLSPEFMQFYGKCMMNPIKPLMAAIEKKSTGVTLVSILKEMPGLQIYEIERTRQSGSKTARFLNVQSYIASQRVSILRTSNHLVLVLDHMEKITANDTHRYDDIADTCVDAIQLGLIDKSVLLPHNVNTHSDKTLDAMSQSLNRRLRLRSGKSSWRKQ